MFRRNPRPRLGVVLLVLGIAGLIVGTLGIRPAVLPAAPAAPPATAAAPVASPDFSAIARQAMPAVVNISSARTVRGPEGGPGPFFSDPFFRFFFGEELFRQFGVPRERREQSLGSGVIVRADGVILTNNHVVAQADEIRVTLADKRELRARIAGTDPKTDLAVLRIAGGPFPTLPLGDSDRIQIAEPVLAIGNPFGLSQTVTQGIVSAVGRANVGITDYEDFIQTDAAINPGNSGGALINARGELIGINTAIFSKTGGYMGIGFAVPVNMAKTVMEQILARGRVARGWLGVSIQDVTPAVARSFGRAEAKGALVGDVAPGSPSAAAGVQRGDIILQLNDRPVEDSGQLRNAVAALEPGTTVRLTVWRDGQERRLAVTVGEQPAEVAASRDEETERGPALPGEQRLGLSVVDPTPEALRQLGLPAGARGALVRAVQPGGAAHEAGLRPGDLIQEVNRTPVRSARQFVEAVRRAQGKDLLLLFNRAGSTAYAVVEWPAAG